MVFTLLVVFAILTLGVAGLSAAGFGLTLSTNYLNGIQAEQAAESGIVYAVTAMNNNGGVVNFQSDVVSPWSTVVGSSAQSMGSGYSSITYTVTPWTSLPAGYAANSSSTIWITSLGQAPGQSQRTIGSRLGFLRPFTCGAIDLPTTSNITARFNGNSFGVDGRNYALGSTIPDNSVPATLGISTRTQTDANTVLNALNNQQQDNVQGASVANQVASVSTCQGPSVSRITNTIVPNILSQPGVQTNPVDRTNINGNVTLGTVSSPQITYFNGDTTIKANGNASGAGILIVNGSLTIQGSFNFTGLVIVVGATQIGTDSESNFSGNASVYGAIWTTDLSLTVGGSAGIRYSNAALALANAIPSVPQTLTPQVVDVVSWVQG